MLARLLILVGVILIILGVLKFVGLLSFASAGAVTLIVVGIIVVIATQFLLGGWYGRNRGGPVV
jgi:hypothetical protein